MSVSVRRWEETLGLGKYEFGFAMLIFSLLSGLLDLL